MSSRRIVNNEGKQGEMLLPFFMIISTFPDDVMGERKNYLLNYTRIAFQLKYMVLLNE